MSNAHRDHPERITERCALAECGKRHMPHTKLAKAHRRRAERRRYRGLG